MRASRLALAASVLKQLETGLGILGHQGARTHVTSACWHIESALIPEPSNPPSGRERVSNPAAEGATAPETLRQKGRKRGNTLERG